MASVGNLSFLRRHASVTAAPPARLQVCPPALPRASWWSGLRRWLQSTSLHEAFTSLWAAERPAVPVDGLLDHAREAFFDAIDDIETQAAITLAERIDRARSRQELWHLRAEVFALVSAHRAQAEAQARLTRLNRFFPTRSPRSGFSALEDQR